MKLSKGILNITLSISMLILFLIIVIVGYVYVVRTDEQVDKVNATLNKVNASLNNFQKNSNERWNITFRSFDKVKGAIEGVSERLQDNQVKNLNLTKFNRAALLDSNIMIHKLWENLTGQDPCLYNPLATCINTNISLSVKNITQLVTNASPSPSDIDTPRRAAPE